MRDQTSHLAVACGSIYGHEDFRLVVMLET